MADAIRRLRISYWVGAVTDCVAAAQMLDPRLRQFPAGRKPCAPHPLNNRDVCQQRRALDGKLAKRRDHRFFCCCSSKLRERMVNDLSQSTNGTDYDTG